PVLVTISACSQAYHNNPQSSGQWSMVGGQRFRSRIRTFACSELILVTLELRLYPDRLKPRFPLFDQARNWRLQPGRGECIIEQSQRLFALSPHGDVP